MRCIRFKAAAAALMLVAVGTASAAGPQFTRALEKTYSQGAVQQLELTNLAGQVTISHSDGPVLVRATVVAGADADAQALAERVRIREHIDGHRLSLLVDYPSSDGDTYYYDPHPGHGSYRSEFRYDGRTVTVRGGGSEHGARVHVDINVQVPAGVSLKLTNFVGDMRADGLRTDAALKVHAGTIEATGGHGSISVDSGSGAVRVADYTGEISADTGSGDVYLERVTGPRIAADTGSGSVHMDSAAGGLLYADTGSGSVTLRNVSGSLKVDTGSGGVTATDFTAGDSVHVDTGSGSVRLEGDLSAMRDLYVDTGSGGVHLLTESPPSMRLRVSTSSGGIDVDLPGMTDVRSRRGEFEATLGSGAGKGLIDTGSGGVSFQSE